jgi:hypothetical protein
LPLAVPFPAKCAISVCLKIGVQSTLAISLTLPDVNFPNVTRLALQMPDQPGPSPALAL